MSDGVRPYPDPRVYDDYRLYLLDAMTARWAQDKDGALSTLAAAAGCAVAQIANIVSGRREAQGEVLDGLIRALDLEGDRRTAFLLLVQRALPQSAQSSGRIEEQMRALQRRSSDERRAAQPDPDPVPPHPSVQRFTQGPAQDAPDAAVLAGLTASQDVLSSPDKMFRAFRGLTWTVPRALLPELIETLAASMRRAEQDLHRLAHGTPDGTPLYLLQAQMFPLSRPVDLGPSDREGAPVAEPLAAAPRAAAPRTGPAIPEIWDYLDLPLYLQDWVRRKRHEVQGWSVGRLGLRLQIVESTLHQYIRGSRHPTGEHLEALAEHLTDTPAERAHFELLGQLQQETSLYQMAERWWQVIASLVAARARPPDAVALALLALPELDALCLAADLDGFRPDPAWLGPLCGLTADRAQLAVQFLELTGLWVRDEAGRFRRPNPCTYQLGTSEQQARRQTQQQVRSAQEQARRPHRVQAFWRLEGPVSAEHLERLEQIIVAVLTGVNQTCAAAEQRGLAGEGPPADTVLRIQLCAHPLPVPPRRRKRGEGT